EGNDSNAQRGAHDKHARNAHKGDNLFHSLRNVHNLSFVLWGRQLRHRAIWCSYLPYPSHHPLLPLLPPPLLASSPPRSVVAAATAGTCGPPPPERPAGSRWPAP